jgi:gamma-glutamyl:cysteine ligase YbdK (ATP-grasp superfamily)
MSDVGQAPGRLPLHLFQGYGIELEYMIVDRDTLAARPLTDLVLKEIAGSIVNEVELGATAWSNELVMHVLEMKTNGPTGDLARLPDAFQRDVVRLNGMLAGHGAMLMPTAMHPFFDPETDTRLWPHDNAEIYDAYNRIFGCKGHGWSNLQSVHINLPFANDAEFGKLHAAVRLVLPILPALAASSPIYEGRVSGVMDSRLAFYMENQRAVPSIAGGVIPERAFTRAQYDEMVLQKIYRDIAPHDPGKILQEEWLNSRGAIARWDRHAIEIRVLDIQESPRMDGAMVAGVVSFVRGLADGVFAPLAEQQAWEPAPLREIFVECLRFGGDAVIRDADYLATLGYRGASEPTAAKLWRHLFQRLMGKGGYALRTFQRELEIMTGHGCLAKRILAATGPKPTRETLMPVYRKLCRTLHEGGTFLG